MASVNNALTFNPYRANYFLHLPQDPPRFFSGRSFSRPKGSPSNWELYLTFSLKLKLRATFPLP